MLASEAQVEDIRKNAIIGQEQGAETWVEILQARWEMQLLRPAAQMQDRYNGNEKIEGYFGRTLLKQVAQVFELVQTVSVDMKIGIDSLFCLQSKEMGGSLSTLQAFDAKDGKQERHKSKAEGNVNVGLLCG